MTYSEHLSQFITTQNFQSIPAQVIERAKLHLLDTFGVALAGSVQINGINSLKGLSHIPDTEGKCHVWGSPIKLSAAYAAMANGISSHVLDFDDTHTDSIAHGSAVLAPLVMAMAEDLQLTSEQMLAAYVVGWEVAARVGIASKGSFHQRGFHATAVAGVFGAVSSAANLLDLSAEACAHAIGLTGSQASGVAEYLTNSSSAKCFHAGWAAHAGLISAYLAKAGMTGPMTIFEGRYGLYVTHGISENAQPQDVCSELGERWEMLRVSIKPYPCCHFAHATVDCARMLSDEGIKPEEIESIHCIVDKIAAALICEPLESKYEPKTPYAAKFSLPYLVASGIYDNNLNLASFLPEQLTRKNVLALAKKVSYRYSEPEEIPFPTYFPGSITVKLTNGKTVSKRLDINYGNPENPMKASDVERKFRDNVAGILTPQATEKVIALVSDLENQSVTELAEWLTQTVR